MTARLIIQKGAAAPERIALASPICVGGTPHDTVRVEGAGRAALQLEPSPAGMVVAARVPGARVAGQPLVPGVRRLVRPGERAEFLGVRIELEPPAAPQDGTRALAAELLREAGAGASAVAGPHLLVLTGPDAGLRLALEPGDNTVGRGAQAKLRLRDEEASRLHAAVTLGDAGAAVADLGSKNGVFVNGASIGSGAFALEPGDELCVGSTRLAYVDRTATPEPPLPAPAGESPTEKLPEEAEPPARALPGWAVAGAALLLAVGAAALAAVALA